MTQIAVSSGSSASFTLPAGNRVLIAGQGTYRIGPRGTSARPTVDELIDNNSSIGPYEADCTVQIWANGASTYELIAPSDVLDQTGRPIEGAALRSLVSGAGFPVLDSATAGQDSGWITYYPGVRLAYALDSGSTATTFSVDISADGSTSLGQAFTGTWASTTAEISPPIWLSNPAARFIRFNVLTGGPLSVIKF